MPRLQRTHPLVPYASVDPIIGYGAGHSSNSGRRGAPSLSAGSASASVSASAATDIQPTSVRKIYIQHLVDILHSSLLKSDHARAKRAWAILVRCREVDWYERWRWGLAILNLDVRAESGDAYAGTGMSLSGRDSEEVEDWLKTLRLSAAEKPAILHALILHYIRTAQYRLALDELDTYLTSYPYILSGPLHTYAGLLCFYLAQPESARAPDRASNGGESDGGQGDAGGMRSQGHLGQGQNVTLLKQARTWFVKAIEIGADEVASEFINLIDHPPTNHSLDGTRRATSESSFGATPSTARSAGRTTRSMAHGTSTCSHGSDVGAEVSDSDQEGSGDGSDSDTMA